MNVILAVFAKEKEIEKWLAKVAILGILKRQGKVYTVVVDDTKTNTLIPVIKRKMMPDSIVYTDYYRSYNALDVSEFHHY
ncbi:MAG: transposase [Neisseriaceae bacterium]|nr:transposase [Neisseriaceae bacterium]